MLKDRGIRKGVEVFVKNPAEPDIPERKALVINTYPHPSSWLIVQYENGEQQEVEETHVTTMVEIYRRGYEI